MKFLSKIFKANKSQANTTSKPSKQSDDVKYYKYPPLEGKEDTIHIKKIENYTQGGKFALFHFPKNIGDSFELEIIDDEFNNSRELVPSSIFSRRSQNVRLLGESELSEIRIGLKTNFNIHYLTIGSYQKEAKLNIGDKLNLLFENGEIELFELVEKGYRKDKDSDGVIYESKLEVPLSIIELIGQETIVKWKFEDCKKQKSYMTKTDSKYGFTTEKTQLKSMAQMIKIGLNELNPATNT